MSAERDHIGAFRLRGLIFWLAIFGSALYALEQLAAWPALPMPPESLPTWVQVDVWVRSPFASIEVLEPLLLWACWVVWAWTCASVVLRITVDMVDAATRGAAWVGGLRSASDWITLPIFRRIVDASLAGLILARVATQSPAVEAAPLAAATVVVDGPIVDRSTGRTVAPALGFDLGVREDSRGSGAVTDGVYELIYTVQPDDTLWDIAVRFYGDGTQAEAIFEANIGRPQRDGRTFDRRGLIFPGWSLRIVGPTRGIEAAGDAGWYTVQPGDTLSGIAARLLGDESRWSELFELNRSVTELQNGRVLSRPELIWPGLRLRLTTAQVISAQPPGQSQSAPPAVVPGDETSAPASTIASSSIAQAPGPAVGDAQDVPTGSTTEGPPPIETLAPSGTVLPDGSAQATPTAFVKPAVTLLTPTTDTSPAPWETTAIETGAPEPRASGADGKPEPNLGGDGLSWGLAAATGVAGVIGGALVVARRRRVVVVYHESDVRVRRGFAEWSESASAHEQRAAALAHRIRAFAQAQGCPSADVLAVYAGRSGAAVVMTLAPDEEDHLAAASGAFVPAPASVQLRRIGRRQYQWEQDWPRTIGLRGDEAGLELLPLGLAGDKRILYGRRDKLGHVLVAGNRDAGGNEVLTTLIVELARRQTPDHLELVLLAPPDRQWPVLGTLPHIRLGPVDPTDPVAVDRTLQYYRAELRERLASGRNGYDMVLVVNEWADLGEDAQDLLSAEAQHIGMRVLAATTRFDGELDRRVSQFGTRLVLCVPNEDTSVILVGEPGAEDLDRAGELWPSMQCEMLPPVRAFRLDPGQLQLLIGGLRSDAASDVGIERSSAEWPGRPVSPSSDALARESMEPSNGSHSAVPEVDVATVDVESTVIAAEPVRTAEESRQHLAADTNVFRVDPRELEPAQSVDGVASILGFRLRAFGTHVLMHGDQLVEPPSTYMRAWQVFTAVTCLPRGEASLLRVAALVRPALLDRTDAEAEGWVESKLSQVRHHILAAHMTPGDVERALPVRERVCYPNPELFDIDVHRFMMAADLADMARTAPPPQIDKAITAYRQAHDLYGGQLLEGRHRQHGWALRDTEGDHGPEPSLRDRYWQRKTEVTDRLAELLVQTGRFGEAAGLYAELMRDPGPPYPEVDGYSQYEYRERCARALLTCCGELGDAAALVRARDELIAVLEAINADAGVDEAVELDSETKRLFDELYTRLTTGSSAIAEPDVEYVVG